MSLFRSRKKSFTDGEGSRRPSVEDVPPVPSGFRGKTFRRKKSQPEPKKEVDITTALPSTDDFRTSLLMPNLSARFSMLREQDDPNTKIGKANDDSVLFPKRVSRLDIFGNGQLSDIAEVSSLAGSIRPPFATERSGSYSSADLGGYGTDDEERSIMDRSRQVKGNKFFGGRQKVYMIPVGGSASLRDLRQASKLSQSKVMGRPVYDDDINLAAHRAKEKVAAAESSAKSDHNDRASGEEEPRRSSENSEYNSKRETSSSTNSGPFDGRVSTAATSVASQTASPMSGPISSSTGMQLTKQSSFSTAPQDRPAKGRRLYGQGLDQQIHEQQSSAMNRLNSIQRNFGPGMVHYGNAGQSSSATNLPDRYQKPPQLSTTVGIRTMSPIPGSSNSLAAFDFGTQDERSRSNSRDNYHEARGSPTMSPPMSPTDPTLAAALQPNDVGKATATGAFNKPKTPYSEEQFALRQIQLQEGRETPPPRAFSRTGNYNDITNRDRKGSATSQLSGHSAHSQNQVLFGAKVPSLSNLRHGTNDAGEQAVNGTYLASSSEYESEPSSPDFLNLKAKAQAAYSNVLDPALRHRKYEHDDQHPAFNSRPDLSEEDRNSEISQSLPLQPTDENNIPSNGIDSPTLPFQEPPAQEGLHADLSDLIRGHLRNVSNQSSVYPNSPPRSSHGLPPEAQFTGLQRFPDVNETAKPVIDGIAVEPLSIRARRLLEHATQLKNAPTKAHEVLGGMGNDKVQQVLGGEAPRRSTETVRTVNSSWHDKLKGHTRDASTETQKERLDFANELADRRKQVQHNLKSIVQDGPSSSPVGARITEDNSARAGPLGLLKKASRGSIAGRTDNSSKAMKMLGVNSNFNGLSHSISSDNLILDRTNYGPDSRPRFIPSKSAEQSYLGPGTGPSFRDRSVGAEGRKNFSRRASPSPAPGPERAVSSKTPSPNPNGYGFVRANTDSMAGQQVSYRPAGRARKYSPPQSVKRPIESNRAMPGTMRSASAQGNHTSPAKSHFSNTGSYFPSQMSGSSTQLNTMYAPTFIDSPRASPVTPGFSVHNTPPLEQPNTFTSVNQYPHPPGTRKRSINKEEISIPHFLSGTSSMITVDLPVGASLTNGMDELRADAPPVPPLNPRRRKGQAAQNLFTAFGNKSSNNLSALSTPSTAQTTPNENTPFLPEVTHEEKSTFSADESDHKPRPRNRLRKSSSVGENLSQRARHLALKEAEKLPKSPHVGTTAKSGMF